MASAMMSEKTFLSLPEIIQALVKFSTCDIADALVKQGDPYGGFIPGLVLQSPKKQLEEDTIRIAGPAYTVRYQYLSDDDGSRPRPTLHFVDTAPPGSIIFISTPGGMLNAVWGGVTTLRAQKRGLVGAIVDGRARDLPEIRGLRFPLFARGVATTTPAPVAYVSDVNEPVLFTGEGRELMIRSGDIFVADVNGVVAIPPDLAEETLELVKLIAETENLIAQEIEAGKSFTEASKLRSRVPQVGVIMQ